jgi:hypothetical protein
MAVLKSPSDYPWHFVIFLYLISIVSGAYWLGLDLVPHNWAIPGEEELTIVQGHFAPLKRSLKSPYRFITNDGKNVALGCLPESGMATCLEDSGIDLTVLSREQTQVGYFHVPNWRALALSDVMVTLSAGGKPLLTYSESRKKWLAWSVREKEIDHSPISLAAAVFLPISLFLFALWLTVAKRKLR